MFRADIYFRNRAVSVKQTEIKPLIFRELGDGSAMKESLIYHAAV